MNIHPSAHLDSAAQLGQHISIGPGAVIAAGAVIGDGCVIGPHAVIHGYTTLGAGTVVHAGAIIGDTPQDLAFKRDVVSYVRIGARCVLRENLTIHRGTKEGSATVLGDDCYVMANSHLAHNVNLGNRVIVVSGALLAGYVEVGDGAFISGNAVVHQFCRIGRLAIVGGLSGISKDVPPFCMTRSGTINTVIGLNIIGLRRAGFSTDQRKTLRQAFNTLYRSGLNISQAVAALRSQANDPLFTELADFISQARRGICKGAVADDDDE